jgi:hypothetical protein
MTFARLLLLVWLAWPGATAEPVWKNELTSTKPGDWPAMPPCVLDFKVSWNGMLDAGRMRLEFAPQGIQKPGRLVARSSAASTGAASALFPYQSDFWSEMDASSYQPRLFHAVETARREKVTTRVNHRLGRVEYVEITEPLNKSASTRSEGVFRFTPAYDIFSAMLHVRSQRLAAGDKITLVVHPFDNPYLLRVRVIGREPHLGRPAIRLAVGMAKIDRQTLELRAYRKMHREASLWLSDDADRIPLELRAAVFIGDIRATLVDFRKFRP